MKTTGDRLRSAIGESANQAMNANQPFRPSLFIVSNKENQRDLMGKVLEIRGRGTNMWVLVTPYITSKDGRG